MKNFEIAAINSSFSEATIGTRVTDPAAFYEHLTRAVAAHDASRDRTPGQHYIVLPEAAVATVSAGVGRSTTNPDDYVLRCYRGVVSAFLKRERAAKVENLAVVVYTRSAYLSDPEVSNDLAEVRRIEASDCTHVIVAVLASAGPRPPRSPYRLLKCLAGGNKDAETWTLEEVKQQAQASVNYFDEWCTVAD